MPAMKVAMCGNGRRLTTRPFAGDDFQIICILNGAFRLISLVCVIPVWVMIFEFRLSGGTLMPDDQPFWCRSDEIDLWSLHVSPPTELPTELAEQQQLVGKIDDATRHHIRSMIIPFSLFLIVSLLYNVLDVVLSLAIWNAAATGTPVEPRGREKALVSMFWVKMIFMNLLLLTVLYSGIYLTHSGRMFNYGCSPLSHDAVEYYESTRWYGLFCASMAINAVELLMLPCAILNQIGPVPCIAGKYLCSD